ncbi:MAG: response regulator transcription factor [Burkholderiaceae bacterium]
MSSGSKKIVIVADDHPCIREALERIVGGLHSHTTLYTGPETAELFAIVERRQRQAQELTVVDVALPAAADEVAADNPDTPLMLVSAEERGITANWFVAMESAQPAQQTGSRIEAALEQRQAVMELIESLSRAERSTGHDVRLPAHGLPTVGDLTSLGLTQRQAEVLLLLAEGLANKEIARKLDVSEWTVRHHVSSILERLEVSNRTRAASIARQLGQRQG